MDEKTSQPQVELVIEAEAKDMEAKPATKTTINIKRSSSSSSSSSLRAQILTKSHAGYFRISLSLCSQALLWKILIADPNRERRLFQFVPSTAFGLLWSMALFTLASQSLLYLLRCLLHFDMVKAEFLHHVGVNYLFAPSIAWLLLLQSSPFVAARTLWYQASWWLFVAPVLVLDIKIYGQWFTKGKRFLSTVANPTSQLSVIGNLVAARGAALMEWRESAVCMFSLGMAHYLVLFVTLYQRLSGNDTLPAMLKPVFFLFIGAPSMASLAWQSISGRFDCASKMLFFLSLFLFMSLVSRPKLFTKAMRKFNVAWWAFSFPLTVLALASTQYAQEVNGQTSHALMLLLSSLSFLVSVVLVFITVLHSNTLLLHSKPRPLT